MINFIKHFSEYIGNFEFTFNNNGDISKSLFYFINNDYLVIKKYLENIFGKNEKIDQIFHLYGKNIHHIGYDELNNRYKFYISLYNEDLKISLQIIQKCKDILGIKNKYFLEKDFLKFDCIGFDISEKGIDMKIYELVINENNFHLLPEFIKKEDVKEIGYLKSFSGRKKKFYRFLNYQNINLFKNDFNLLEIDDFQKEIKDLYVLEKKVKYYCIEGEKREIYFI